MAQSSLYRVSGIIGKIFKKEFMSNDLIGTAPGMTAESEQHEQIRKRPPSSPWRVPLWLHFLRSPLAVIFL